MYLDRSCNSGVFVPAAQYR